MKISNGNRGRPKHTWMREIYDDLKPINKRIKGLTEDDYERSEWEKTAIKLTS